MQDKAQHCIKNMNHILILDIGKTNKKCLVFDEDYRLVFEKSDTLPETADEDGYPCEDVHLLKQWVEETLRNLLSDARFQIRALHCTTYGASFVHLDENGNPLTPLYNYLKPFPDALKKQFFDTYGGEDSMALETASPVLGMLNSGLQLYWIKHSKPLIFNKIHRSLHLPQYIAKLMSDFGMSNIGGDTRPKSEIPKSDMEMTSIGCHTMLWNFQKNDYHAWVKAEGIFEKFRMSDVGCRHSNLESEIRNPKSEIGSGLHDSSAALLPYLACFQEPFVLISTGTWCISLNPFNEEPLTAEELAQDCLCYLTPAGKPVKAARYFGGHEHEQFVKNTAEVLNAAGDFYKKMDKNLPAGATPDEALLHQQYSEFMHHLVEKQVHSTRLAIGGTAVRRIYVDGGFSKNKIYMTLLAEAFPQMDIFAAEVAQATALGAALSMHAAWNTRPIPEKLIALQQY